MAGKNSESSYIERQYQKFINAHGYFPEMFNVKNATEVTDAAPCLGTSSGSFSGIGAVLILTKKKVETE